MMTRFLLFHQTQDTTEEERFRTIATLLVGEGAAPAWFADIEFVTWDGKTKDLACIPGADVQQTLLVDDFEVFVHPGQESQRVRVDYFGPPYDEHDTGLAKVLATLQRRLGGTDAV
jgi:hypothetical protein